MKNNEAGWDDPRDTSPRHFLRAVAPRTTPIGRGTGREDVVAFSESIIPIASHILYIVILCTFILFIILNQGNIFRNKIIYRF